MIYWFANYPDGPERFPYDTPQYEADEAYLTSLIEEIRNQQPREFDLTSEEKRCRYCPYRSLCRRGETAGDRTDAEEEWELDEDFGLSVDLEHVAEIEY